jgi:hypothetical protein
MKRWQVRKSRCPRYEIISNAMQHIVCILLFRDC